jgi:ribosome recycling factor
MSSKYPELDKKCETTLDRFKKELAKLRTGRANSAMLDSVNVEYYGSSVPLKQLALVNSPEPRVLLIQPYDAGAAASIEKAIQQSDLGLNPARDGNVIRVIIPSLSEERRKDLIKHVHKLSEEFRVMIRNHRRETIDGLKAKEKKKEISEDEVQKVTDKYIKFIDETLVAKEKDLMEV